MRDIQGYEGLYGVTSCGRVWSYRQKKFLKTRLDHYGYQLVNLCKDGKKKTFLIHRLVAQAYLPNPANLPQINHKDENKENNCVNNLEFCTAQYNVAYSMGKKVVCVETGEEFSSIREAAKSVNKSHTLMINHLRGEIPMCGEKHFKLKEEI